MTWVPGEALRADGGREGASLLPRELLAAVIVAAAVGIVFPYATLHLGFGPNVSIVSTLLGFVVLKAAGGCGRRALHLAHAAGVAAGQTAFMGVALAAFDILRARDPAGFLLHPSPPAVFAWTASAGALGVLCALPLRRHYIEEEKLTFAAGAAAAETIAALHQGGRGEEDKKDVECNEPGPRRRLVALGASFAGAAIFTWLRPASLGVSPLAVGSGMLLGLRVAVSMALGCAAAWLCPPALLPWVGAALVVSGGLTVALARWPRVLRAGQMTASSGTADDKRRWLLAAGAALGALCIVDRWALHLPVAMTLACVAMAAPLLLVGTRVLGETNWAPVLSLATAAQAVLASVVPGNLAATIAGGALCGAIPNGGQHMMQSFRAASILGASARATAMAQLVGVLVGSLSLSVTFPMLAAHRSVSSPLSEAWATSAEALAQGPSAIPHAAMIAIGLAAACGAILGLCERRFRALPSAPALGIGMLVPWGLAAGVLAGAVLAWLGSRRAPGRGADGVAVASGLVAGEAVTACAMAALGR